jgi:signal transduction histidine kinase
VFAAANIAVMGMLAGEDGGTVPFHFIWVSLTVLYGYTVWRPGPTTIVLVLVMASTASMILLEIVRGPTRPDELTEVPLMAAMFCAMVWHARRRAAAQLQAIRSRERERDFVRDSSHHLKTPLGLARGYAELIRAGRLTTEQRHDVDVLITELDGLTKIVERLLLVMTVERPELIERRPVDLEQLLLGVMGRWMDAVDRNWTVRLDVAGALLADGERLECAFDALIENAVEATRQGDRISVTASEEHGLTTIRIADEGRGIPHDSIDHIFERFWTNAGRHDRRGTGLGLAIVKAIVDAHGGTISVRSDAAETVFTVSLGQFVPRADGRHAVGDSGFTHVTAASISSTEEA